MRTRRLQLGELEVSASLSGTCQDWTWSGFGPATRRVRATGTATIGGIDPSVQGVTCPGDGQQIEWCNVGSGTHTFVNEDAGSVERFRISTPSGSSLAVPAKGILKLLYDGELSRWLCVSIGASAGGGGPHTHEQSEVTSLEADLAAKADASHAHAQADVTGLVTDLIGKAAAVHSHAQSDVTNLVADLASKADATHGHAQADVTGLVTDLAGKVPTTRTLTATSPITGGGDLSADWSIGFDQTAALGNNARVAVSKGGVAVGTRRGVNLIEGSNVTLTVADNAGAERVDVTIAAAAGGGGGPATCKKTADQTFNSATPANVTGLSFAVTAGAYYHFRFVVLYQSNTATVGIGLSVTHPGATRFGGTVNVTGIAADGTAAALHGAITASDDAVLGTAVAAINTDYIAVVEGVYLASASGTLQLRARTETGTTPVIVRQGSCGFLTTL